MKQALRALGLASFLLAGAVHGAEIAAPGGISAVTVFADRALVTRTAEVALPKGDTTVVVGGLPGNLLPESVRVKGQGPAGLVIGAVETRPVFSEQLVREQEQRLTDELLGLQDQQRELDDRIKALQVRLRVIESIGQEAPATVKDEIARGKLAPETWKQAWMTLGAGAAETYAEIQKVEIRKRELDNRIAKTEAELDQVRTGRRDALEARIEVAAAHAGSARLTVEYQVHGASWEPLYDARLDSEAGTLNLAQLGQVQQNTGEDWTGVQLTLSTAQPSRSAELPELDPWFVDLADNELEARRKAEMAQRGKMESERRPMAAPTVAAPAEMRQAQAVSSEFAAEYRIPGVATVPADDAPHKFGLATLDLPAEITVQAVPKLAPRAYLQAKATYGGAMPLLPGRVALFREGTYIGNGSLDLLRPGEALKLSFGVDDKVRVKHQLETGGRAREGVFSRSKRVERRYRIDVANYHARPITITVQDGLPVPQDERIKVELLQGTAPTAQDVEGRKGVLAWTYEYAPKEEKAIAFGYALSYPEDARVPGF